MPRRRSSPLRQLSRRQAAGASHRRDSKTFDCCHPRRPWTRFLAVGFVRPLLPHRPGGPLVLLDGFNHVATLTNDSARLQGFYEEVFDAEVVRDGPETPADAAVRMTVIRMGPHSE